MLSLQFELKLYNNLSLNIYRFIFLFHIRVTSTIAAICGTQLLANKALLSKTFTLFLKPRTKWKLFIRVEVYRGALCACTHDGHRDNGFIAINVAHRRVRYYAVAALDRNRWKG